MISMFVIADEFWCRICAGWNLRWVKQLGGSSPCHLPGERVEALYNGKWYGCTVVRMRATDADVAVDGGEWTVEVATEMRAATAAVPSQTQQLAEVSGLRWVGETPPAIAIAECEKAEGARAEGGERKRKREGCGL